MRNQCTECDEFEAKCQCKRPSFIQVTEEKDWKNLKTMPTKKDKGTPDVKKKTKGMIGDVFVESILYQNIPYFLINDGGVVGIVERLTHENVIYEPLQSDEVGYFPYNFDSMYLSLLKNNPPTRQQILDDLKKIVDTYIDANQIDRNLILGDLLLSYCQDWIDTLHFVYFVGETESGKSSGLHLFRWLGYRPLYGEDIPNADIYNFLGTEEEAAGTICEDEAQEININREKIRTYKNSYSRGATKARIIGVDSTRKRQVYYKTFCLKLFAGESIPDDKGFGERLAVIYMTEGQPEGNIKRLSNEQKSHLMHLRNKMIYWKVANYHKGLQPVVSHLTKRDQELWEDFLKITNGTSYFTGSLEVVNHFTKQRHEKIWGSLESRIYKLVIRALNDDFTLQMEAFWHNLTDITAIQTELSGSTDRQTFYPNDYNVKVTRNSLAKIFEQKFKATKQIKYHTKSDKSKMQITMYKFDAKTLLKLSNKYNVEDLPLFISGRSDVSGKLDDHIDDVDHFKETDST
ncbi:MAG: hypothetical protein ACW9W4_06320 [Candidatus Nitrosopumilus sp. bin_7KS]